MEPLRNQLARLRVLYAEDRATGLPGVWLPEGLARKYPKAGVTWEWQWVFPSREASIDPASGVLRRHHVLDGAVQDFIRKAARAAGLDKRVTPHVLRHSFGTHMMEGGADIRTVQELMGHESVETTQMYLHVMLKNGTGAMSPLDKLKAGSTGSLQASPLDWLKSELARLLAGGPANPSPASPPNPPPPGPAAPPGSTKTVP